MVIQAIETQYKGYRFRSRLEARWAVFLDVLGVEYRYEMEGYNLGSGVWYLPDFWLPDLECWLEIKPKQPDWRNPAHPDIQKPKRLAQQSRKTVFMFYDCWPIEIHGMEVAATEGIDIYNSGNYFCPDGDYDGMVEFGICLYCDKVFIGLAQHFAHHFPTHSTCPGEDIISWEKPQRLLEAYYTARSMRFK